MPSDPAHTKSGFENSPLSAQVRACLEYEKSLSEAALKKGCVDVHFHLRAGSGSAQMMLLELREIVQTGALPPTGAPALSRASDEVIDRFEDAKVRETKAAISRAVDAPPASVLPFSLTANEREVLRDFVVWLALVSSAAAEDGAASGEGPRAKAISEWVDE